jgi:hypothetical protein
LHHQKREIIGCNFLSGMANSSAKGSHKNDVKKYHSTHKFLKIYLYRYFKDFMQPAVIAGD